MYESAPKRANAAMNTSAGAKLPPFAKKPITIGTIIEARPPIKLKLHPLNQLNV